MSGIVNSTGAVSGIVGTTVGTPSSVTGINEGLVVKYVNATTVDIDADFLTLFTTDNVGVLVSSVNLTAAITSSGVNGLDTGAEAAIWYHIWVIYNGTTTASLLSASATSPTMPAGYTYKKYVGAVYNPSSSFRNFFQSGNDCQIAEITFHSGTSTTSWVSHGVATILPTTAKSVIGRCSINWDGTPDAGNTEEVNVSGHNTGLGQGGAHMIAIGGSVTRVYYVVSYHITLETAQTIYVKTTYTGRGISARINSWEYEGIV